MKCSKDIGFATIHRNLPITSEIINPIIKGFKLNKKIFKRTPKKFKVIICDNEKDLKKEAKYYYQKWMTATVLRNNNLVTRSPAFIEKIGRWKRKDFPSIINHEMSHVFWTFLYKHPKPCWLDEGLACYIGKNFRITKKELKEIIRKYKVDYSFVDYRPLKRKFTKGHYPRYPVWAEFTRYIVGKYTIADIIKLMDGFVKKPVRKEYDRLFRKYFGKSERNLFGEFKRLI